MRKPSSSKRKAKSAPGRKKKPPARSASRASATSASRANAKAKPKQAAHARRSPMPARPETVPAARPFRDENGVAIGLLVAPFLVLTLAVAGAEWIGPKDSARRQFALLPAALVAAAAAPSAPTIAVAAQGHGELLVPEAPAQVPLASAQPRHVLPAPLTRLAAVLPPGTRLDEAAPVRSVVAKLARPGRASICAAPTVLAASPPQSQPLQSLSPAAFGRQLAQAALAQTRDLVVYQDRYRQIGFPMGDVPDFYGVCTDVVVRAYRSLGIDLQVLVHKARIGTGDTSIDHRRTGTLRRFFARYGSSLPVTDFAEDYRPGDIVTYHRASGRRSQSHIAIVSEVTAPSGRPMIVHNRGWGPQLEDALFASHVTGHYRFMPEGTIAGRMAGEVRAPLAAHAAAQTPLAGAVNASASR